MVEEREAREEVRSYVREDWDVEEGGDGGDWAVHHRVGVKWRLGVNWLGCRCEKEARPD